MSDFIVDYIADCTIGKQSVRAMYDLEYITVDDIFKAYFIVAVKPEHDHEACLRFAEITHVLSCLLQTIDRREYIRLFNTYCNKLSPGERLILFGSEF